MKKTAFGYLEQWCKTSKDKKKKNNNNTRHNDNRRRVSISRSPLIFFVKLWALSIQPDSDSGTFDTQAIGSEKSNATEIPGQTFSNT